MTRASTIFFDLDGPILDNKWRHYGLYRDLLLELSPDKNALDAADYWSMKRDQIPEIDILKKTGIEDQNTIDYYAKMRLEKIESPSYLILNRIVDGAIDLLEQLQHSYRLILVTLRRNRKNLLWELGERNLIAYFHRVLSDGYNSDPWETKIRLISQIQFNPQESILVGDTEAEIIAGRELKIRTVAVCNGIRTKEFIEKLKPDLIIESIRKFPQTF